MDGSGFKFIVAWRFLALAMNSEAAHKKQTQFIQAVPQTLGISHLVDVVLVEGSICDIKKVF